MLKHFLQNPKPVNIFKIYLEHLYKDCHKRYLMVLEIPFAFFFFSWYLCTELWVRHKPVSAHDVRSSQYVHIPPGSHIPQTSNYYKTLKNKVTIIILKCMLPSAEFFLEYYVLCQGTGDRRNKSAHLCPHLETKLVSANIT